MLKKSVALLACLCLIFACAGCGQSDSASGEQKEVDLAEFYDTMLTDAKEQGLVMEAVEGDMLDVLYPGLSEVACKQMVVYAPPMSAVAYEAALVEVENADDVDTVKEIFQARIDSQSTEGPGMYPETVEQWQKNAYLESNGNYVMLVVGEGADADVSAFQALFE